MAQEKSDNAIKKHAAASKIQAAIEGFFARKNYAVKQLPLIELKNNMVHIKGNDPKIQSLPHHGKDEQIALIATSGMRSVEIACELSSKTPKLIILDNSMQVIGFWREARRLITNCDSPSDFLCSLSLYLDTSKCARMYLENYNLHYLEQLFSNYGFDRIKAIISGAAIIAQSWADKNIIYKIKNILALIEINTIYTYSSNIVAYLYDCGEKENALQVLKNIQTLNPVLAIHTDLASNRPENVFMIDNHDPKYVEDKLNLRQIDTPHDYIACLLDLLIIPVPAFTSNTSFVHCEPLDDFDEKKEEVPDPTDDFSFYAS